MSAIWEKISCCHYNKNHYMAGYFSDSLVYFFIAGLLRAFTMLRYFVIF